MARIKRQGYNWAQTPIWMVCDPELSDGAARLFNYLDWRAGSGTAFPAINTIALDMGKSEATVRRSLRELEALGYVTTSQRNGRSSLYTVNHDARTQFTPQARVVEDEADPLQNCNPLQNCEGTPCKNDTPPLAKMTPITRESNERIEPELCPNATPATTTTGADAPAHSAPTPRKSSEPSPELLPASQDERVLFGLLHEAARAQGRNGPKRFANPEQARAFRAAVAVLNGKTQDVLKTFMRGGGGALGNAVAYVAGAARKEAEARADKARMLTPGRDGEYVSADEFFQA